MTKTNTGFNAGFLRKRTGGNSFTINYRCRSVFFLITIMLFFAYAATAQKAILKFSHISTEDGLSQMNVTSILQDQRGFMWFGTRDGLNRYDGYKIKVYKNVPGDSTSLSYNFVQALYEDSKGTIWIGTLGGGLCKFDRYNEQFVTYRHDERNSNSISNNVVNKILEDSQGNLWVSTNMGLNMFDVRKNKFYRYIHDKSNPTSISDNTVTGIQEDSDHNLWIGTHHGGLNLFNRKML